MEISIDIFEGPLDLLLYLVKKKQVNIFDIPISEITNEYLEYITLMRDLNIEIAGEFLVMAATLILIKSKSMLPQDEAVEIEEDELKEKLLQKLAEYERFKSASEVLNKLIENQKDIFYRSKPIFPDDELRLNITVFELIGALKDILGKIPPEIKELIREEIPIEEKIKEIIEILSQVSEITFTELILQEKTRYAVIALFLALLEVIRLGQVKVEQKELFGEIYIKSCNRTNLEG